MSDLSDVERDAWEVVQALAGLDRHLARRAGGPDERLLRAVAEEGGEAAGRVLAYLRELRGAGDGAATAYPVRLGPWREWCPPRGHLLCEAGHVPGGDADDEDCGDEPPGGDLPQPGRRSRGGAGVPDRRRARPRPPGRGDPGE